MEEEHWPWAKDEVLKCLSFLEGLNKEAIILEMDDYFLKTFPEFNNEDLERILQELTSQKKVKTYKAKNGEILYQKTMPKKSLWRRFLTKILP